VAKKWMIKEDKILNENFASANWNDLLKMLPNKAEHEILVRASKLGLKRKSDKITEYYDEEKEAWVETSVHYGKIKSTVSSVFPAKEGISFETARNRVGEKIAKMFSKWYFDSTNGGFNDPELDKFGCKAFISKQFNDNEGFEEAKKQLLEVAQTKAKQVES
jgi:hypothetical protein